MSTARQAKEQRMVQMAEKQKDRERKMGNCLEFYLQSKPLKITVVHWGMGSIWKAYILRTEGRRERRKEKNGKGKGSIGTKY